MPNTAGDIFTVEVRHGSVSGTIMGSTNRYEVAAAGSTQDGRTYRTNAFTIAAGTRTPILTVTRTTGTGAMASLNGAQTTIVIEDVGQGGAPA